MSDQNSPSEEGDGSRTGVYVEDLVILVTLVPLFILGVFFRFTWWGQTGLVVLLVVMAAVFVRRFRRVHRAFTGRDEQA